jgi:hypothetical protein
MLAGFGLIALGAYENGFQTVGGTFVVAAIAIPAMRNQCKRYGIAQVRAIVDDPARASAARSAFNELTSDCFVYKQAA